MHSVSLVGKTASKGLLTFLAQCQHLDPFSQYFPTKLSSIEIYGKFVFYAIFTLICLFVYLSNTSAILGYLAVKGPQELITKVLYYKKCDFVI